MDYPKKGRYRHFKGGEYELLYIARHSETDEPMVVYKALYECGETPLGERIWVRPLSMWTETVTRQGQTFPRFAYIGESAAAPGEEDAVPGAEDAAPYEDAPYADEAYEDEAFFAFVPDEPPYDEAYEAPLPEEAYPYADEEASFIPDESPAPPMGTAQSVLSPAEAKAAYADRIRDILSSVYGYRSFRPGQEEIILNILAGRDSLGVMPTGAGKSLCYQVPALALEGVAIVVSPLISLMKDQVAQLKQSGVSAAYINSSLSESQQDAALSKAMDGAYRLIYVAPERLMTPRFQRLCRSVKISLIAIDEAHCISQWGQDFRPSYLDIPRFLASFPSRPKLCAFTATATERVREDICRLIGLKDPFLQITGFDRPNLYFKVLRASGKRAALEKLMRSYTDMSGIIYCATRKQTEEVCALLSQNGYNATRYHAGLSEEERKRNQEAFSLDEIPIMVATNAFGMGIDKSNVRFVIHYSLPKDLESYYQEAGRAGRDGMRADCVLLYSPADVHTQKFFIDHLGEEAGLSEHEAEPLKRAARRRLDAMIKYATSNKCLRGQILSYFGQDAPEKCGACSVCDGLYEQVNATKAAQAILSVVDEMRYSVGAGLLNEIARGSGSENIKRRNYNRLVHYGVLANLKTSVISEIIEAMEEADVLSRSTGQYPTLSPGTQAQALRDGELRITIVKPDEPGDKRRRRSNVNGAPADASLMNELKALRMQLARERHIAPFMVFSDASLLSMTQVMPHTSEEFMRVTGVGSKKCREYAQVFIDCITKWETAQQRTE